MTIKIIQFFKISHKLGSHETIVYVKILSAMHDTSKMLDKVPHVTVGMKELGVIGFVIPARTE